MKNMNRFSSILLLICISWFSRSCIIIDKPAIPTLFTLQPSETTASEVWTGGQITSDDIDLVTSTGVCWSKNDMPTINDDYLIVPVDNTRRGFSTTIDGLQYATTYYVRAFATNKAGTGYGESKSFTTKGNAPEAHTGTTETIARTQASVYGRVNANYLTTDVSFEYGTELPYTDIAIPFLNSQVGWHGLTKVYVTITGLVPGTQYHFRIKAQNVMGITYGDDKTFTTLP
jgi:hypothetical protein